MAKDVNILPNLRIDIPDLTSITSGYSRDQQNELINKLILDNFARVSDGFRVEISDQTISPGVFTVYNGLSFDKSGQLITNFDEENSSRSQTLSANATYYVEVEYITQESDTDARAFWDPSYSNGLDPSGDTRPSGREFDQNVATRITPDWQIVTPISTTEFSYVANPDTTRIPVAVLTRSGGQITGGSTSPASTILKKAAAVTTTSLTGLDTRIMLDAFTLRINDGGSPTETITVTSNDRVNGILSLGSGLANNYDAGVILNCEDGNAAQFLNERANGTIPDSGTQDARPRLFQGDEEAGYIVSLDPYNSGARSDVEVKKLKQEIDFLAAQIREIKFGHAQASEIGNTPPPLTFNSFPRYFDSSGGLVPARTNTVSIGDGASSWGDFNTTRSGSAQAAIQAAHDALPADGGIVYLKNGVYTFTNTAVQTTKPIWFIGDGSDATIIRGAGTASMFHIDTSAHDGYIRFDSLTFDTTTGFTGAYAITFDDVCRVSTKNCIIKGGINAATNGGVECMFETTQFHTSTLGNGICVNGLFTNSSWTNCTFDLDQDTSGARCVSLGTNSSNNKFESCKFNGNATDDPAGLIALAATSTYSYFTSCHFDSDSATTPAFVTTSGASNVYIDSCNCLLNAGLGTFIGASNIKITETDVSFGTDTFGVEFDSTSKYLFINNCIFKQLTTGVSASGTGVVFTAATDTEMANCTFIDNDIAVGYISLERALFNNINVVNPTDGRGLYGIKNIDTGATFKDIQINGLYVKDLDQPNNDDVGALVHIDDDDDSIFANVTINNLQLQSIDNGAYETISGIKVDVPTTATAIPRNIAISNCVIKDFNNSDTSSTGVYISDVRNLSVTGCQFDTLDSNGAAFGVNVKNGDGVSINGSNFYNIGSFASNDNCYGVFVGDIGTSSTTCLNVSVVGNNIRDIDSASQGFAVKLNQAAQYVNVSSNTILQGVDDSAIFINAGNAGGADMTDIVINGNVINTCLYGILVELNDNSTDIEGRVGVTGNVIRHYANTGIFLRGAVGASVDDNKCFTVVGNTVDSGSDTVVGIRLDDATNIAVVGNNVSLSSATGSSIGIDLNSCTYGTLASNCVRSAATTGKVVDTNTSASLNITGNYVRGNTSADGLNIEATTSFVAANYSINSGSGADIGAPGASTITRARSDADGSSDPDDSSSATVAADIGLNRRPN